jgi:hypothetical protein
MVRDPWFVNRLKLHAYKQAQPFFDKSEGLVIPAAAGTGLILASKASKNSSFLILHS